ncbi:unnamed protein product [Bursaphelenchus xylophilus]|uniref:Crossover junction endonuclease MUS81 n=1 Tax=Bursaphelenchus xylophilus TaxID=6326 RepID=A0A1I7RY20_BURXY|nr:unnamed protein product [Bursaphelenchus xylophilus]CAG9085198.1 unnamed protein product [Bursaphelenchus xylophilus]
MPPKAVKVNLIYPENYFYEKVLNDWKNNASDANGRFVVSKALENLRKYPLRINGYSDLKTIKGVGEDFATRLDSALKFYKELSKSDSLSLKEIRAIKNGDALQFLCESTVSRGKKTIPFLSVEARTNVRLMAKFTGVGYELKTKSSEQKPKPCCSNVGTGIVQGSIDTESTISFLAPTSSTLRISTPRKDIFSDIVNEEQSLLEFHPNHGSNAQVLLVVDNRENRNDGRSKGLCDHLQRKNVQYDLRPLSVGDFLWTLSVGSGHENEMVLDFIVERKTWDDLKTSIRQSRYHEQKQRLKQSGVKNIILLVEGPNSRVDPSLEQAIVSTCIQDGFMVQRVQNLAETAHFLRDLTNYLTKRINSESVSGQSFSTFQDESKKTKEVTVSDCFLKQLTVCPRVSTNKAKEIVARFPSLRALRSLYSRGFSQVSHEDKLQNAMPTIPASVSRQVSLFFS